MTIFDEVASVQAPINIVWRESFNLAKRGRLEREELDKILFASHLKLGYVYLMKENPDGSTYIRHVIDTANKVREALESNQDPWKALDELASLTDTPGREKAKKTSGVIQSIFALIGLGEAGEFFDTSYIQDTGKSQLGRVKKRSEKAAKKL